MTTSFNITTALVFILLGTSSEFIRHSVVAHDIHGVERHSEDNDHDESVEHNNNNNLKSTEHRGLRTLTEPVTPVTVGDQTYASKNDFVHSGNRCGTKTPSSEQRTATNDAMRKWVTENKVKVTTSNSTSKALIKVNTYFHVITAGTVGAITNAMLKSQFNVLNKSFKPYGFLFRFMKTTRTNNRKWYYATYNSSIEKDMFGTLGVDDKSTLNVYFSGADDALGYAYFPDDQTLDGVVILTGTVPGGTITDFNLGTTLVHEVGHWLGLEHTFFTDHPSENGCRGNGDRVDDTPKQREPTFGCPVGQDTCQRNPGLDPVNNFMDYSDDVCMTKFSAGQKDRMLAMWDTFRA